MHWHAPLRAAGLVLALFTLGSCARDTTSPPAPMAPRLALSGTAGSYIVLFKSAGVPADLSARVQALGGNVTYAHAPTGLALVSGLDAAGAAALKAGKDVSLVEPDVEFRLDDRAGVAESSPMDVVQSVANPAGALRYSRQWNMRDINAPAAWSASKLGDSGVTVAILDTGLDYDNYDLSGLVDLSRSESFDSTDDALTAQYFPARNPINDYNGHGTNVATQVASKAVIFAGVTSKTTIIGVKVLGWSGRGTLTSVLKGVLWAADHGADVANMSLGGGFFRLGAGSRLALINRAFAYAAQKGMLIVVAAGNSAMNLDEGTVWVTDSSKKSLARPVAYANTYCEMTHVLCVSAVGPLAATDVGTSAQDAFAAYSNYGRSAISVAAPGGNFTEDAQGNLLYASWVYGLCARHTLAGVDTTGVPLLLGCNVPAGYFVSLGFIGTSQATPHVSGLAASLVAEGLHGQPQLLKQRIQASADDLGQPGTDPYYGRGRINVARALGL